MNWRGKQSGVGIADGRNVPLQCWYNIGKEMKTEGAFCSIEDKETETEVALCSDLGKVTETERSVPFM